MSRRLISSGSSFEAKIGYSRAVVDGDFVFVAGTTGFDYKAGTLPDGVVAQCEQTFKNIGDILLSVELGFHNVAQMITYITRRDDVDQFYAARTELFPSLFGEAMYPPNTLLIVAGLVRPELLVEVQVIATG